MPHVNRNLVLGLQCIAISRLLSSKIKASHYFFEIKPLFVDTWRWPLFSRFCSGECVSEKACIECKIWLLWNFFYPQRVCQFWSIPVPPGILQQPQIRQTLERSLFRGGWNFPALIPPSQLSSLPNVCCNVVLPCNFDTHRRFKFVSLSVEAAKALSWQVHDSSYSLFSLCSQVLVVWNWFSVKRRNGLSKSLSSAKLGFTVRAKKKELFHSISQPRNRTRQFVVVQSSAGPCELVRTSLLHQQGH